MKNLIIMFLAFLFFTTPVLAESAYDRVLKTNTLRCAYGAADPHIYKDLETGEITGPVADIAREMAEHLELEIEWTEEVGYADFAEGLKTGRYDAFCGILTMAPTRARAVAFTDPLFYLIFEVFVRAGDDRFTAYEDFNAPGLKAGATDGEVFQIMTRKHFPAAQEVSLPNMTPQGQLLYELAQGKTDFVLHDAIQRWHYEKSNPGQIKSALDEPLEVYPIAYAVAPEEYKLRDMLNVSLRALHNLGRIDDILNEYGMTDQFILRQKHEYKD